MARRTRPGNQKGAAYLLLLLLIVLFSLSLAVTGSLWSLDKHREQETELQFVGDQYCKAIKLYALSTPDQQKRYPANLNDLLQDNRFVTPRRYLRKLYPDPITQTPDWGLIRASDNGIIGIYSQSEQKPLRQFPDQRASYRDWKFLCDDGYGK